MHDLLNHYFNVASNQVPILKNRLPLIHLVDVGWIRWHFVFSVTYMQRRDIFGIFILANKMRGFFSKWTRRSSKTLADRHENRKSSFINRLIVSLPSPRQPVCRYRMNSHIPFLFTGFWCSDFYFHLQTSCKTMLCKTRSLGSNRNSGHKLPVASLILRLQIGELPQVFVAVRQLGESILTG